MESACRDAMIRHSTSDKLEDLSSQDVCESESKQPAISNNNNSNSNRSSRAEETPPAVVADTQVSSDDVNSENEKKVAVTVDRESSSAVKESEETKKSNEEENKSPIVKESEVEPPSDRKDNEGTVAKESNDEVAKQEESQEEIKDCDKPKSVSEEDQKQEEKESQLPATEPVEVMDLDSQDTSSEPTEVAVPINAEEKSDKVETSEVGQVQENKTEGEEKVQNPPKDVPEILEKVSSPAENHEEEKRVVEQAEATLKRKRSPTPEKEQTQSPKEVETNEQKRSKREEAPNRPLSPATTTTAANKLSETATEHLQRELQENFGKHDKLLREYITRSSVDSPDALKKHVDQLVLEIETLNDMIRTKEMEWNNLLHLRKVKEELVMRLTRKRHVEEIEEASLEKTASLAHSLSSLSSDVTLAADSPYGTSKAAVQANKLIQNLQLSGSSLTGAASKTTQSILHNRASMTTEDLEKEKKNTAKLHRLI